MSLSTDREYHLRRLRLALLRYALPTGATSDGPAPNPFSTIKAWEPDSHSIALCELDDVALWPELRCGRESPPLAWSFNKLATSQHEQTRGATGLNYTDTIGGSNHFGMRVDRRRRSGRKSLRIDVPSPSSNGSDGAQKSADSSRDDSEAPQTQAADSLRFRSNMEHASEEQSADVVGSSTDEAPELRLFRSTSPVENRTRDNRPPISSSQKVLVEQSDPSLESSLLVSSRITPLSRHGPSSDASLAFTNRDPPLLGKTTSSDDVAAPVELSRPNAAPEPLAAAVEPSPAPARSKPEQRPKSIIFNKVASKPGPRQQSALSQMLHVEADQKAASVYAGLLSSSSDAIKLNMYFPQSQDSRDVLKMAVRRDLTVNDVIIAAIYSYVREERKPTLPCQTDEELAREASKWNLRIVEDDGEVDDDFPALDRTRTIVSFRFPGFAVVRNAPIPSNAPTTGPQASAVDAASGSQHVQLVVRPPSQGTIVRQPFEIVVDPQTKLGDVLNNALAHFKLNRLQGWGLVAHFDDADAVVAVDRSVDLLGETRELTIASEAQLAAVQAGKRRLTVSEVASMSPSHFAAAAVDNLDGMPDYAMPFQRFSVYRRMPMPLGRHHRTLTIDGEYVHSLPPSDARGLLDGGGRTHSFHITNIKDCRLSTRSPVTFKLVVQKNRRDKLYEFEAETPEDAQKVVATVRRLLET